jgi:hypothetical protein
MGAMFIIGWITLIFINKINVAGQSAKRIKRSLYDIILRRKNTGG